MMISKRSWLLGGLAVILVGSGALLVGHGRASEAGPDCRFDGAWLLRFGDGLIYQTISTDPSGSRGTVRLSPVVSNPAILPIPGPPVPGPGAIGTVRRLSRDSWEFSVIGHATSVTTAEDMGEVIYIEVFEGVAQLVDCDTELATIERYRLYAGDADADGDGLPDPDAEPLVEASGIQASAKRI